jgi:Beta-propeller repeat
VTRSPDFPLRGPLPFATAGADAFVAKLDPRGRTLRYATRLGGSGNDDGSAITVDPRGAAYVSGHTSSLDFPLTTPARGGEGPTRSSAPAPDGAFAEGLARSSAAARDGAFAEGPARSSAAAGGGAFVARLARDGASLGFSTRLDGAPTDAGLGIAVSRSGSIAVAGTQGADGFASVLASSPLARLGHQPAPRRPDRPQP